MRLGQRAPQHRKVLGVGVGKSAIDRSVARNDTVAQKLLLVEAKQGAPVGYQRSQFLKTALVK